MIRLLFRLLGLVIALAGFVALVIDGTRSIAGSRLIYTVVGETWRMIHPDSLVALQALLERRQLGWLWDPGVLTLMVLPTALVGLGLGALFLLIGRRREPRIGVIGRR
jgi:hypothetical protein